MCRSPRKMQTHNRWMLPFPMAIPSVSFPWITMIFRNSGSYCKSLGRDHPHGSHGPALARLSVHVRQARKNRHTDRLAHQRFEATMQGMMMSQSHHSSSDSLAVPFALNVPIGKYYTVPDQEPSSEPLQSRVSPQANHAPSVHLPHMPRYDGPSHHANEPPFLAILTKTSNCLKFKKYLEDSVLLALDSLSSLELLVDGIKSALDMV
jgi:hypothetical protein